MTQRTVVLDLFWEISELFEDVTKSANPFFTKSMCLYTCENLYPNFRGHLEL